MLNKEMLFVTKENLITATEVTSSKTCLCCGSSRRWHKGTVGTGTEALKWFNMFVLWLLKAMAPRNRGTVGTGREALEWFNIFVLWLLKAMEMCSSYSN